MKFRLIAVAAAALVVSAGIASAQDTSTEKGKLSYALGYQYGQELQGLIARGEQLDIAALVKGVQDSAAKKEPTVNVDQLRTAVQNFQKREQGRMEQAKAEWDKQAAENKTKSDAFLTANRGKAGVKVLPSGVQYRVIETGTGAKPTLASTVEVEAAGPFPMGQRPPQAQPAQKMPTVKVSEIQLVGIREALLQMPAGSKWEVTIPADKAYGANPGTGFPPNVAVQFEVKLVSVK
jgi:peptidylprolyl isomerase